MALFTKIKSSRYTLPLIIALVSNFYYYVFIEFFSSRGGLLNFYRATLDFYIGFGNITIILLVLMLAFQFARNRQFNSTLYLIATSISISFAFGIIYQKLTYPSVIPFHDAKAEALQTRFYTSVCIVVTLGIFCLIMHLIKGRARKD
jgi:hypothetical protein